MDQSISVHGLIFLVFLEYFGKSYEIINRSHRIYINKTNEDVNKTIFYEKIQT